MILVLFGTNPYSFDRLAKAVEELASEGMEKIITQRGHTRCMIKNVECFDFLPKQQLHELIDQADIVITQGGFGSIADCLERNKRIIAVPRKQELGECKDSGDGQEELVRELERQGKIIAVYDIDELEMALKKARVFNSRKSESSRIPALIAEFVATIEKR